MLHFFAARLLPDYLAGRLPAKKRPALAGHLQLCPICREKATEILGNLRRNMEPSPPPSSSAKIQPSATADRPLEKGRAKDPE